MKNYAVVANIKAEQKGIIDDVFDKGYDQGYHDGKLDGKAENIEKLEKSLDAEKKAEYDRGFDEGYARAKLITTNDAYEAGYDKGYEKGKQESIEACKKCERTWQDGYTEGYDKGLQHSQELRIEEAKCAEACGMKRAWEAARKILHMEQRDINKMMGGSDFGDINIIDELTPQEVIAKLEEWEKKNTTTLCRKCIHAHNMHDNILTCDAVPCVIEDGHCDKYEEKQEQSKKHCENCDHYCGDDNKFKCDIKGVLCIERDRWTPKQEQTKKNCDNCKYNNREKTAFPCSACITMTNGFTMWEAKKDYVRDATPEESKSVNDYIKSISEETGVPWGEKEEQTEKSCDNCKHDNVASGIDGTCYECVKGVQDNYEEKSCKTCKSNPPGKKWPCVDCDISIHDRYEPKQDAPEMNVESIAVWDEVEDNLGNRTVVTRIYSDDKYANADVIDADGCCSCMPLELLEKTGRRFCFQELLNAMKKDDVEEAETNEDK